MGIRRRQFLLTTAGAGIAIGCSSLTNKAYGLIENDREQPTAPSQQRTVTQYLQAIDAWAKIEYSPRTVRNWYSNVFLLIRRKHVSSYLKNYFMENNELPNSKHYLGYTDENNVTGRKIYVGMVNFYRLNEEIESILFLHQ